MGLHQQNSVNATVPKIPYPWLVFNEKVKVNSVFIRDSTGVSDSVLLLFGGNISRGGLVCSLTLLCLACFSEILFLMENMFITPTWFFVGWTPEDVGRILGVFHESCISKYIC